MTGISLIEMLIALLVLSFGLIGVAGLQAQSLRNNLNAHHRSMATTYGNQLLDRLRADRRAAWVAAEQKYDFDPIFDYGDPLNPVYPSPAASGVAQATLNNWRGQLASLPNGTGAVDCDALGVCVVVVEWDESRGAAPGYETRLRLSTRL